MQIQGEDPGAVPEGDAGKDTGVDWGNISRVIQRNAEGSISGPGVSQCQFFHTFTTAVEFYVQRNRVVPLCRRLTFRLNASGILLFDCVEFSLNDTRFFLFNAGAGERTDSSGPSTNEAALAPLHQDQVSFWGGHDISAWIILCQNHSFRKHKTKLFSRDGSKQQRCVFRDSRL